jgi:DNA polymerase-3 subunit chi
VLAGDPLASQTPIIVTTVDTDPTPHYDMLVNLTRRTPATFDRYARVFEIISTNEDDAAEGRKRYVAYKKLAHPLTHFVAGKP